MSPNNNFISASGLRPMSAFVVVAGVLCVVAGWLVNVVAGSEAKQPDRVVNDKREPFPYSIQDGTGRTLARFVPRFDLEMSPRSMWQAHTPVHMAQEISRALGGSPTPAELLDAMLPDGEDGVIEVKAWDLTPRQALRLQEWIDLGAGSGAGALDGIWVLAAPPTAQEKRPRYHVSWRPELLLSKEVREQHGYHSAWSWARALAAGIDSALGGERRAKDGKKPAALSDARRSTIWEAMLPTAFTRPVVGLPPECALELREELTDEGVAPWQMRVAYGRDRHYPSGEHQLFGSWGWLAPTDINAQPREGLELYCQDLLESEAFAFIEKDQAVYRWLRDRTVRGQRANSFVGYTKASEPPIVHSTIEVPLQRYLRRCLDDLMSEHRPAIAMAIALDIESGDVLAVDGVEDYVLQPFAPLFHAFTPGSTMKIMTMACALESGAVVDPWSENIDVGLGSFALRPLLGCSRVIHEAEGTLTGVHPLADFFARSVNAAFVQVGLRMDSKLHRDFLVGMGYGTKPGASLGPETGGYLRSLPWSECNTHASVSFGHEMTTSLWQHAQALASILRGGRMLPLRVVNAVEQNGVVHPVPLVEGKRVISPETSATIRQLMEHGAIDGTGRKVQRDDLVMGTKTGTAQKVPGELCLHVELAARNQWERDGLNPTKARIKGLKQRPKPHKNCYTSSMVVFGSVRGATGEDFREVMVFVVADEPRGKSKYGSDVAGATAMRILVEALGLTRDGDQLSDEEFLGFVFAPGTTPAELIDLNQTAIEERVSKYASGLATMIDFDALVGGR